MPAYSVPIIRPVCGCGKAATLEVRNTRNEPVANTCRACGAELVRRLNIEGPHRPTGSSSLWAGPVVRATSALPVACTPGGR